LGLLQNSEVYRLLPVVLIFLKPRVSSSVKNREGLSLANGQGPGFSLLVMTMLRASLCFLIVSQRLNANVDSVYL
jgi:hypothetical protein